MSNLAHGDEFARDADHYTRADLGRILTGEDVNDAPDRRLPGHRDEDAEARSLANRRAD
jgi:hypothetical protein